MATFSVCFRGLSRLDDDDDLGKPCVFSSSCCCCENRRPNSATLGFSRFAGVPVRVRERALSYRAFLLLPKGPDSSGGRRGLRDSLGTSWSALIGKELQISLDILFVDITPREQVAIFVSGAFLQWDGVVLHDGRWDVVKG